jgi:hypothetical protein
MWFALAQAVAAQPRELWDLSRAFSEQASFGTGFG